LQLTLRIFRAVHAVLDLYFDRFAFWNSTLPYSARRIKIRNPTEESLTTSILHHHRQQQVKGRKDKGRLQFLSSASNFSSFNPLHLYIVMFPSGPLPHQQPQPSSQQPQTQAQQQQPPPPPSSSASLSTSDNVFWSPPVPPHAVIPQQPPTILQRPGPPPQIQPNTVVNGGMQVDFQGDYAQIFEWVSQLLKGPEGREKALLELSKKREQYEDLALILWHSFGIHFICSRLLILQV